MTGHRDKYDVKIPFALKSYLLVHFIAVVYGYLTLTAIPRPVSENDQKFYKYILIFIVKIEPRIRKFLKRGQFSAEQQQLVG